MALPRGELSQAATNNEREKRKPGEAPESTASAKERAGTARAAQRGTARDGQFCATIVKRMATYHQAVSRNYLPSQAFASRTRTSNLHAGKFGKRKEMPGTPISGCYDGHNTHLASPLATTLENAPGSDRSQKSKVRVCVLLL